MGWGGGSSRDKERHQPLAPLFGGGSGVPLPPWGGFVQKHGGPGTRIGRTPPLFYPGVPPPLPPPQIEAVRSYLSSHLGQEGLHNILLIAAESSFFHHFFNPRQMGSDPPRVPFTFFWRFFPLKNITQRNTTYLVCSICPIRSRSPKNGPKRSQPPFLREFELKMAKEGWTSV